MRRVVQQDGVAEVPRGRAKRTRGARREPAALAPPTGKASDGIAGLPKGVRVEGTSWFVEGLPETLTKAQKAREAENRVFGISALAAWTAEGLQALQGLQNRERVPAREQVQRSSR